MKAGLKELTHKNNGWGNDFRKIKLGQFITGRVNYFSLADMKSRLPKTDERLRRRIRAVYRKQQKRVKTGYKMIRKFNLPEWKVHEIANCRKGIRRASIMLNSVTYK